MTPDPTDSTDGDRSLAEAFADPAPEYGPVPLWWWDGDDLDPERLTAQLEALNEGGVPSVCFISKYPTGFAGDEFEYFSETWWDCMEHAVAECERLDMRLWVHDETYHLGPENANGNQYWQDKLRTGTTADPDLRGHVLDRVAAEVDPGEDASLDLPAALDPLVVAAYPRGEDGALRLEDAVDLDVDGEEESGDANGKAGRRIEWTAPDGGVNERTDAAWHVTAIGRRPEGLCYTDRAAAERYLDLHFEEYVRRLGDAVGETLAGTFEDEIHLLDGSIPADDAVLERVREEHGYDPVPRLVGLYEAVTAGGEAMADDGRAPAEGTAPADTGEIRRDYYDAVTALLEECWFRPLHDWHEDHDLLRSHDNWGRNDLANGTEQYGDYYRTMRWYGAPGYDDGGPTSIGERNFFDAKLSASIAACYDRERVWGELFHSTGWGFEPADQLAGIVENVCYGCTLYDMHGLYYTTKGGWWAHAPGDVHFRHPYWEDIGELNAAAARLCELFSRGDPVVDAALLFPTASLHGDWHPEEGVGEAGREVDAATREVAAALYESGTDLVIADPESLEGAATGAGGIDVAGTETPALVLPPVTAIEASTLATIRECYDAGGVVVAVGRLPSTVRGAEDAALADALDYVFGGRPGEAAPAGERRVTENGAGGAGVLVGRDADPGALLDDLIDPDVRAPADVYHRHQRIGDRDAYLLFNARDEERTAEVRLRAAGTPERWDPLTGETEPVRNVETDDGGTRLSVEFAPHGFELLVFGPGTGESRIEAAAESGVDAPTTVELDGWTFEPVPVLDNAWGDFRYPASDAVLGPEVRRIRYRREGRDEDGLDEGWFDAEGEGVAETETDEAEWRTVRPTHGPYVRRWTGASDEEPAAIPSPGGGSQASGSNAPGGAPPGWEPYAFSKATGRAGTHPYVNGHGYSATVSGEFLVAPEGERAQFWTTVRAPADGMAGLQFGPGIERIDLGGLAMTDLSLSRGGTDLPDSLARPPRQRRIVHLTEGLTPLRVAVEPGVETHVALEPVEEDARERDLANVPRMPWFRGEDPYVLDTRPWDADPVGWYRFELPAGTAAFDLPVRGDARAWVDGIERPVQDDGRVTLDPPGEAPTPAAVRVAQERGRYGGAAWEGPVSVETAPVSSALRSWEDLGFGDYSGRGRYRATADLPEVDPGDRVVLDLGELHVAAAVRVNGTGVGSVFSRPYEVDVSGAVEPGENEVEIEAANTLANHFRSETPRSWADQYGGADALANVAREGTVSGLLGPVTVRIEPRDAAGR